MDEHARDLQPTAPGSGDPLAVPTGGAARCSLCDAFLDEGAERCPSCGLWHGSLRDPVSRPTLMRVALAFGALYGVVLVIVALAR